MPGVQRQGRGTADDLHSVAPVRGVGGELLEARHHGAVGDEVAPIEPARLVEVATQEGASLGVLAARALVIDEWKVGRAEVSRQGVGVDQHYAVVKIGELIVAGGVEWVEEGRERGGVVERACAIGGVAVVVSMGHGELCVEDCWCSWHREWSTRRGWTSRGGSRRWTVFCSRERWAEPPREARRYRIAFSAPSRP